jgi:hypothetical protein
MVQPAGDGVPLFYAAVVLLALSWFTFIARATVRIWRKTLGLDDWLMFLGLVSVQKDSLSPKASKTY